MTTTQAVQRSQAGYSDIEHCADMEPAPLSFQQERLFYLHKLSAEGPLWNRISCKRLMGTLDLPLLQNAVDALVERHPALRTRISVAGGRPLQSRHDTLREAFSVLDISDQPTYEVAERAREILNQVYEKPVPVEGGELFQAVLVRCSGSESHLILKLHHIISDATTFQILWSDLKTLYNAQLDGGEELSALEIEYSDYARWVHREFAEDDTKEQESYWLSQFAGELPKLDLPTDYPARPNVTFIGALEKQDLSEQFVKRLRSFSLERRVIPFSTMLSAYYLLLRQYCRQDDIVVGTVFLGRHYSPKIRRVAGVFSNTVALRARLEGSQTAEEFVRYVHAQITDAYAMQDYPFERLVDRLAPNREHSRNPLFRAMFNMVTSYEERHSFEGIEGEEWLEPEICATQVDFFLDFHLKPAGSDVRVEYNTDIFSKTTIQRMLRHYVTLVEKIMDDPCAQLRELSLFDEAEEKLVLSLSEGATEPPACPHGILALLEERAAKMPDQAAVLFGDEVITCGQLNERVNRLAATLIARGVSGSDTVGVMLERSPEMVLGLLAIWKAGAAYLPIDPSFPAHRIEYILQDSGVNCLLVQDEAQMTPPTGNGSAPLRLIALGDEDSYSGDGTNPGRRIHPSSPAYVIYTSGSTGNPKGVVVEHRALWNTLEFLEARYPIRGGTLLLKTNYTFDVSTSELFGWLFDDGRLAVLEPGAEKDPQQLLRSIERYAVTHVNFVPSMLDVFLSGLREPDVRTLEQLKYVFVAGEALKPDLVSLFHDTIRDLRLENLYGPTEAAVYATWYPLPRSQESRRVPIGKPLSNTRAYVLDNDLRLLPIGVNGELCLSGPGLAREYLNSPELTDEVFRPNPYWEGQRIYRTGDVARWGDDGQIYFLGRCDGQVKVRGFRVELGEIERKLLACRSVTEVAVTAREDQFGQQGLVAYVVTDDGSIDDVRTELASWLPGYMVPEIFVEMERLPRTASGKVDHPSLPEPVRHITPSAGPASAPTALEQIIIEIAEELLNTTGLDPDSNFFRLGGNSLLTLRFVAALDDALGTRLSIMDFLDLPTIAEAARLIEPLRPGRTSAEVGVAAAPFGAESTGSASQSRSEGGGR